jgi:hypothetical protein
MLCHLVYANIPSISCLLQKLRWLSYCGSDNTFRQVGMSKPKNLFPMGKSEKIDIDMICAPRY